MTKYMLEIIPYVLLSLIVGSIVFYLLDRFLRHLTNQKKMELLAAKARESLPAKLQAYERMLLFCERINPVKMLLRIKPVTTDTETYLHLLMTTIEQEFEHNFVQQMYVTNDCWRAITTAKATIINDLKEAAQSTEEANKFREKVLLSYSERLPATNTPLTLIRKEVAYLLNF